MWAIRDSDGAETLHSIYPSWATDLDFLTIVPYVPKAGYDAVVKELEAAQKELTTARKLAARHITVLRENGARMRTIESANNKYYALLQQYQLCQDKKLDDTPIIDVKV